ncbi:MAG: cyclodeaminase/cyclohydrolase family protein [Candidatus Omnitrophica bacterium]|nr:cyclodeaminase/cyclohydrolase family protein [Candidatus Omnitrophota bacterium]
MVSSRWSIEKFLKRLGSSEPVPGGGSAAALAAALGCSLGGMVAHILLSRPRIKGAARSSVWKELRALDSLSRELQRLIERDARAYEGLLQAQRSGRSVAAARRRAAGSPRAICAAATKALRRIDRLAPWAGPYLGSDLKAGRALLRGAFEAARVTAEINLK